jgi:uncharacterized protein
MSLKRKIRKYDSEVKYCFRCFGHPNIRAKHSKTIEFTKDAEIGVKADCIIGVKADFESLELKEFKGRILIVVESEDVTDEFHAMVNPDYNDDREVVLRKGQYLSERTFGIMLNKGADGLKREIANKMRKSGKEMLVTIYQKPVIKL